MSVFTIFCEPSAQMTVGIGHAVVVIELFSVIRFACVWCQGPVAALLQMGFVLGRLLWWGREARRGGGRGREHRRLWWVLWLGLGGEWWVVVWVVRLGFECDGRRLTGLLFAVFGATVFEPDLDSGLGQAGEYGELLSHHNVWVLGLLEGSFQCLQLWVGEGSSISSMLSQRGIVKFTLEDVIWGRKKEWSIWIS